MKPRILLVEDETDLGNVVRQYLEMEMPEFQVDWVNNGRAAYERLKTRQTHYQIALIDVSMPEMDGFELAEKIVQLGLNLPFLFLTARNEKSDRLYGLKIGADDYISKPFDIDELVLRIRNILKRNAGVVIAADNRSAIAREDVIFYKETLKLVIKNTNEIDLTPREAELLDYLFRNENRVLKREEILTQLWGQNDYFLGRSLDVFISRLRKHLNDSDFISIDNVYGVGFVFQVRRK
ncbi:MAG TPA: response regulator transcription factor [Puia sp.]|jgi:DNA-binding response OmpR family regulator